MTLETSVLVSYFIWSAFAFFEGRQEAFWFHIQDFNRPFPRNPHVEFTLRRACVLILSMLTVRYNGQDAGWVDVMTAISVAFVSQTFAFPFFHDGAYYMMRNIYNSDVYPMGWLSDPTYIKDDMGAKFSLRWSIRAPLFLTGFTIMLVFVLLK